MTLRSLSGAVVLVTGGGRGIGRAIAHAMAREGARVAIGDIDASLAAREAVAIGGYGAGLDVRDRASFAGFVDAARAALGPIDVLVSNAGIMPAGPFTEVPRYLGLVPTLQSLAPRWLVGRVRRAIGDRRVLEQLDHEARATYDARIARLADDGGPR